MQSRSSNHDLVLSNGAVVDFKVKKDVSGNPVISELSISFPIGSRIPEGGITAALLREIRMTDLLSTWFQESRKAFLTASEERILWSILAQSWRPNGRNPISSELYAALSYFYVQSCEGPTTSPTLDLATKLEIGARTLSTRLTQARKLGLLTAGATRSPAGKAGGELSAEAKRLIANLVKVR
jgi:hypothetical protein